MGVRGGDGGYEHGGHAEDDVESEPADPPSVDQSARRDTRLAPPLFDIDRLPTPLVECGCDDCILVDPLSGFDAAETGYAANECPNPRPMTVERAAEAYLRYDRSAFNSEERTSRYERANARYAKLLDADRQLRRAFDGLTTVILTRRLSPINVDCSCGEQRAETTSRRSREGGRWLTPVALDEQLHGDVTTSLMNALRYQLDGFDYEYVGVTAATDSAATPHEHLLVWIDDPDDEITVDHFETALDKHVEKVPNADAADHPIHADGRRGAITVRHDPPLVDDVERDTITGILDESTVAEDGSVPLHTAAAQYVAAQLPSLVLGDVYDGSADAHADSVRVDGAAVAWASPYDTVRSSRGIDL